MKVMVEEVVRECGLKYNFDASEALSSLSCVSVSLSSSKVSKESKSKSKSLFPLPCVLSLSEESCRGLRHNGGLYTQCQVRKGAEDLCKVCSAQASKNESGKPDYGRMEDRMKVGLMEFKDPSGRSPTAYTKVMKKHKVTEEMVLSEAEKHGVTVDRVHFEVVEESEGKRGRPKGEPKEKSEKQSKGRPRKSKKVVEIEGETDDLFASLVASANAEVPAAAVEVPAPVEVPMPVEVVAPVVKAAKAVKAPKAAKAPVEVPVEVPVEAPVEAPVEVPAEVPVEVPAEVPVEAPAVEKQSKAEEKKAQAALEKQLKAEEKKAQAALEKQLKTEAAALEKQLKADEKKAKAEEKKTKSDEKKVKSDEKKAKTEEKKAIAPVAAEDEPDVVKKFEFEGVKYLKSKKTGIVYNLEQDVVGQWNESSNKIDFSETKEEEEEEEYDE